MEVSYKEEVSVGALVILGLVAFTLGMFWLTGRSIVSKGIGVDVVFKDVSGLREGDPCASAGLPRGRGRGLHRDRGGKGSDPSILATTGRPPLDATAPV